MAFVPDYESDVFISYAHAINQRDWVGNLAEELRKILAERLSPPPKIWLSEDENRIHKGDFRYEIGTALRKTALLITINGMPWAQSEECRREKQKFEEAFGQDPQTSAKDRRIMEVCHSLLLPARTPYKHWENSDPVWFCPKNAGLDPFEPGEVNYKDALSQLVGRVQTCLTTMWESAVPVYLHPPKPHPKWGAGWITTYSRLRDHLNQKCRLLEQPDDTARLSVHVFDKIIDSEALSVLKRTVEMNNPRSRCVAILSPEVARISKHPVTLACEDYAKRGANLQMFRDQNFFDWGACKARIDDYISGLKDKPAPKTAKIYVIYGQSDEEECRNRLKDLLEDPVDGLRNLIETYSGIVDVKSQGEQFRWCDAALVVWQESEKDWFIPHYNQMYDLQWFLDEDREPVANGVCLMNPDRAKQTVLSQCREDRPLERFVEVNYLGAPGTGPTGRCQLDPARLEPFLTGLRELRAQRAAAQ